MTDYQRYINALRKCAKEHEGDRTFTGQIIVSNLCQDTANLLETLEQESTTRNCFGCKYSKDNHNAGTEECHLCMWENQYTPTTKNLGVDCISRAEMLRYQEYLHGKMSNEENHKLWEFIKELPSVTPQEPCDKCEVGNPCLYCKHEFEPQEGEGMTKEEAWRRTKGYLYDVLSGEEADEIIKALEPKTGHWKSTIVGNPICSECGFISEYFVSNYCPNCGCRMVESQESEG